MFSMIATTIIIPSNLALGICKALLAMGKEERH
jgi:hypothetical protein